MEKSFQLLMAVVFFCCTTPAYATNSWSTAYEIVQIRTVPNGGFTISMSSTVNTACAAMGANTVYIYPDQNGVTLEAAKAMMTVALTALTTGMRVKVYYDDSTEYCYGRQLAIYK